MQFEEVKVVWNKVIPSIRERLNAVELVDYITDYFSPTSCQRMKAQDKQHGQAAANDEFFEEAKRKPGSFPRILAALKKENQHDVLIEILKSVRKHIKEDRYAFVLQLIRNAGKSLSISVEEEIATSEGLLSLNNQPVTSNQDNVSPAVSAINQVLQPSLGHVPGREQPAILTEAHVPNPRPSGVQSSGQIIYQRLQKSLPDIPLDDLKATSRKQISQALMALHADDRDLVWQVLLDNADLDINGQKAREIEKSRHPGKEFYDTLRDLDYTTRQLIDLLETHDCPDAANIVRQEAGNVATINSNQPPVIPQYKQDLAKFDENNLDLARQRSQEEQQSKLNIQTAQKSPQPNSTSNSLSSLEHSDISDNKSYISGELSIDSLTEIKGTQALEAVGDRENEKSTLPPDGEREKLRNDRIRQHDDNQSNLNSFKDIKEASNQSKDINMSNEPSSHDFSSTSELNQPELYQQHGASQNPGSQSNVQETDTQPDRTKNIQLEHMEGPVNYAAQLEAESMRKLHSDGGSNSIPLSSLQLNEYRPQTTDPRRPDRAIPPRESEDFDQEQSSKDNSLDRNNETNE